MPTIRAVSVAKPSTHVVNQQEMATSIVREAAREPIFFGLEGPRDNATAMHTEQVCVFCAERYDHWARVLGIDRSQWADCRFGENLMVAGLTEEEVHVGDRLLTSGGVLLEITGPRSNCAKLTWRMGAPPTFLRTLVGAGWIGYYLRVLEPGWIAPGDGISIETARPDQPTIAGLTRAIHEEKAPDLAFLRAAAGADGLGMQTGEIIKKRICDAEDLWRTKVDRWPGWRDFRVEQAERVSAEAVSLTLRPVDGAPIAPYRAGQFLTVRLPARAQAVIRNWSISDYDPDGTTYRITVKREPQGIGSNWVHGARPGSVVALRPPAGHFVLDRSTLRRVILVSAGIGMTPLFAMLKAHAARGEDASPLIWLHSTRSSATNLFAGEVDALLRNNPSFSRQLHFSAPVPGDELGEDYDRLGRISAETIADLVGQPYDLLLIGRAVKVAGYNNEVYICGPPDFENRVRNAFLDAGTPPQYIRSEAFVPRTGEVGALPVDEAHVTFEPAGRVLRWTEDSGTLLDLAIDLGLDPPYSCRTGSCGSCVAVLEQGMARHDPMPQAPLADNQILLCCARPTADRLRIRLPLPAAGTTRG